jgi:hypothetical protein
MSDEYVLLSTKDNPFNPHTQWDEWFAWDYPRYDTNGLLDHVIRTSYELPENLRREAFNDAVEEIVTENVSGMHIKVVRPSSMETESD